MSGLADVIKEVHPIYYVSDLKRSIEFYTEKLGLKKAWEFGSDIVGIQVLPKFLFVLAEDREKIRAETAPAVVFAVDEIDKVVEDLTARGIVFDGPPVEKPYGRIASFKDPDGYAFDLVG